MIRGLLMYLLVAGTTVAQTNAPILRIEAGMHTSKVNSVDVDAEGRYVVTGSDDKTCRVWDANSGQLIRVLRPPMGAGTEGEIVSVAISGDGSIVACGGFTGLEWDQSGSIYVFDRAGGRMVRRIVGLPAVILHLRFSKDNKHLVATLGGGGVRVYDTSTWTLTAEDFYMAPSYGADFDLSGRLVTTCLDGYIRVYDVSQVSGTLMVPTSKSTPVSGMQPFSVAFSPDGSMIAVGFYDGPRVDVFSLSGNSLSHSFSPKIKEAKVGNLASVCWSSDGHYLYAGGVVVEKERFLILRWRDWGRGLMEELPAAENTITSIRPMADGKIVYGAADPTFGVLRADGTRLLIMEKPIADFRNQAQELLISPAGTDVSFGYEQLKKGQARFQMLSRELLLDSKDQKLTSALTKSKKIKIEDWQNSAVLKLNKQSLPLQELSRSLAISPDERSFVIGLDHSICRLDASAAAIWCLPRPTAWALNISANGKLVVAAYADGTIRWHRLSDGKELLAFFPHADKKRWVLWTPSGYYDASPGGEDLIGWSVNNGKDIEADFYPASKFRSVYYRPDIVSMVLETLDEEQAIASANAASNRTKQEVKIENLRPPVLVITHPAYGEEVTSNAVTFKYMVKTPANDPISGIKVLLDGRPVASERGMKVMSGVSSEIHVTIPQHDCDVSLIAENSAGTSEPATIRLKWKGKTSEEFVVKPRLHVLAIGVSQYQDKELTLGLPAKDASDFAEAMKLQGGSLYREVVTKVLTDQTATKNDILDGLEWIQKETTSKDIAMIFLAGHGVNDQTGIFHFLPVDANTEKIKRTCLPFSDIVNTVSSIAGKVIVFADACHSGNIMGSRRGVADINAVVNELSSAENGAVTFTSSTGKQYSLEDKAWGNGAFTKALIEGLSGKADYKGTGRITVKMLDLYVSERVKELTKGQQSPTTVIPPNVPDFPVVTLK